MKVFKSRLAESADSLIWVHDSAIQQIEMVDSSPQSLAPAWQAPSMIFEHRAQEKRSDLTLIGLRHCFRNSARVLAHDLLAGHGEFLPIVVEGRERWWLFHTITEVPALIPEKSRFITFRDGRIIRFESYWFDSAQIGNLPLFRLPGRPGVYLTDRFVDFYQAQQLTGLEFKLLWDSAWTIPPVPMLIISGYWPANAWSEDETAQRALTTLTDLRHLDPALEQWQRPASTKLKSSRNRLELTTGHIATALAKMQVNSRNSDAIYYDGGIRNVQTDEITVEFSAACGSSEVFVNSPWGGVAHLRLMDLRETRTRYATPQGVLELFNVLRAAWPVEHLVARAHLFQEWQELKRYPVIGWITSLAAPSSRLLPDPRLPLGVEIIERDGPVLTIQLTPRLEDVNVDIVAATRLSLETQGWLEPFSGHDV